MATEPLSTRIPSELMAQVRAEIENSQTTLTAMVTRLLTAGLAAEATSALLNSRLEAADAELARLKAANSSTSSALAVPTNADDGITVFASPDRFSNRFDDPYFEIAKPAAPSAFAPSWLTASACFCGVSRLAQRSS